MERRIRRRPGKETRYRMIRKKKKEEKGGKSDMEGGKRGVGEVKEADGGEC